MSEFVKSVGKVLNLEPGDSTVFHDDKNGKTYATVRITKTEKMKEEIHETMVEAFKKAGIEVRD
ncbi:MAG: hypothetical protein PHH12_01460 [Candidatus Shapirobacteria bacterium]|jgi:hypothetical protein|nr:hypothetical protein [Candidatus Shapirobacteria bacterium]